MQTRGVLVEEDHFLDQVLQLVLHNRLKAIEMARQLIRYTVVVDQHSVGSRDIKVGRIVRIVRRRIIRHEHHRDHVLGKRILLEIRLDCLHILLIDRKTINHCISNHFEQVTIVRIVRFCREIQLIVLFVTHIDNSIYVTCPDHIVNTVIYHHYRVMRLRELLRLDTSTTHFVKERNHFVLRLSGHNAA